MASQESVPGGLANEGTALPELTPERWQQIKDLFAAALELDPDRRSAFLVEACGADEALRSEVESLLAAAESEPTTPNTDQGFASSAGGVRPDALVGQHVGTYRIERQIGRGGMATVYLAARADEHFHKQVAIKILLPERDSEDLLQRFRAERQTLAVLDHPNIVKLLDGGNTDQGLPYLVMDYVEGEPIDEYCDRHKLSTENRLRLFEQVCQAVQCAHDNHVVHRDLKPSNILVTPKGVPKLLDFGIAKVLEPSHASQALVTQTRTRRMTPAYASPEQVKTTPVTTATDVYSLGVILYELLTGHRPYKLKQNTPADIERAICDEDPEKPSTAVDRVETADSAQGVPVTKTPETVSQTREGDPEKLRRCLRGDLDTILLVALQKEPHRRYASVLALSEDIQQHLDHLPVHARRPTYPYLASRFAARHKIEGVTVTLAILVVLASLLAAQWKQRRNSQKDSTEAVEYIPGRRSVAVLGFKNLSGRPETSWLSTALSEMLTTELAAGGKLRAVSGENIARIKTDLSLPDADSLSAETLARVRKNLETDYVILGSYLDMGGDNAQPVRLDVRLQDAARGETIAAVGLNGTEGDLPNLIGQAGESLRNRLGAGPSSPDETKSFRASQPSNIQAARDYAEGLERLRAFDALGACEVLEKAIASDPSYAMAHSALAEALADLGYESLAAKEAKKAFELATALPREQNLLVEGQYEETARQWEKAIEVYRTLFNFFPDNLDYGLRLISAQTSVSKGSDSFAIIEAVRKLPTPLRDDPRIDLAEARVAGSISDYKRQASAAEQAARKAQSLGTRLLLARAELEGANALHALGDQPGGKAKCENARRVFREAGDHSGEASALLNLSAILITQGEFDKAKEALQGSIKIDDELGYRAGELNALGQMTTLLYRQGDMGGSKQAADKYLAVAREIDDRVQEGRALNQVGRAELRLAELKQAKQHFEEALTIQRSTGNLHDTATTLNNLGTLLMDDGDFSGAKREFDESLQLGRRSGDMTDIATASVNLGGLYLNYGKPALARKPLAEALKLFRATGNQPAICHTLDAQAQVLWIQGDLLDARKSVEELLAIQEKLGAKANAADSRLSLAGIAVDQGRPSEAEHFARQAVDDLHAEKDVKGEAEAEAFLTQALRNEGRLQEAQQAIEAARPVAARSGDISLQLPVAIEYARLQARLGKTTEATRLLQDAIAQAQKARLLPFEFDARLALADVEMGAGDHAASADLVSLERDSSSHGFLLIARKAAEARKHKAPMTAKESR